MIYEVILDSGETPNKCTIAPLRYRSDFHLMRVRGPNVFGPLQSTFLLHPEGECLSTLRERIVDTSTVTGIASIDCVWRRLEGLRRRIVGDCPTLARIPDGFVTAYPRRSRHDDVDPDGGLATIEAIFVAAALLGQWDVSLLSEYYFGTAFIELNRERFLALGVSAAQEQELPLPFSRTRNASQRRRDRGRAALE